MSTGDGAAPEDSWAGDHRLAAAAATAAGRVLMTLRADQAAAPSGSVFSLRDEADERAQGELVALLGEACPDDAVLSEEAPDISHRGEGGRVWIIDPLDGTREFAEGRTDWAVHVALWDAGALRAGAVALPALAVTLHTGAPPALPPARDGQPRIAVSRTRPPQVAVAVAERLGAELVPMGSAGAKAMAVVRGEVDAYVHAGGQYEWDSAAPVAVAESAGLHASRLDGAPLRYNNEDPWLPDLLICRAELAAPVLETVEEWARGVRDLTG